MIEQLKEILDKNNDKRVIVVGTTCSGKSTLIKKIESAKDMDDLVFPLLSKDEKDYVCQDVWTKDIGKTMTRLVKERVIVENGKPVFGTVVLDCDLIIFLNVKDSLLRERCNTRKVKFENAKNMKRQILKEIIESKTPCIEIKEK